MLMFLKTLLPYQVIAIDLLPVVKLLILLVDIKSELDALKDVKIIDSTLIYLMLKLN